MSVPSARMGVPATLQASLMARLDRLGSAAKGVAQMGAAIGREYSYELAAAVGETLGRKAPGRHSEGSVDAGLVFQRGAAADGRVPVQARARGRRPPTAPRCVALGSNSMPRSPSAGNPFPRGYGKPARAPCTALRRGRIS